MDKIYFDMNDKEKQLQHIGDTLSYAICAFSEGLSGTGEYNINTKEVIELQSKIADKLISAQNDMITLLNAVQVREEENGLRYHTVDGKEDLKGLTGCTVYHVSDNENADMEYYSIDIAFHNEKTGKYINLSYDNKEGLLISDEY